MYLSSRHILSDGCQYGILHVYISCLGEIQRNEHVTLCIQRREQEISGKREINHFFSKRQDHPPRSPSPISPSPPATTRTSISHPSYYIDPDPMERSKEIRKKKTVGSFFCELTLVEDIDEKGIR